MPQTHCANLTLIWSPSETAFLNLISAGINEYAPNTYWLAQFTTENKTKQKYSPDTLFDRKVNS